MDKKDTKKINDDYVELLIDEAKELLNKLFLSQMNINNTENLKLEGVDRLIDCIINASILKTALIQKEALMANNPIQKDAK